VDAYQGGVSVDSAIGEGTTFTVYFPVYHESFSASTTLH
jgi:signal transduction histidine kinase